jgi:hypothetical protein
VTRNGKLHRRKAERGTGRVLVLNAQHMSRASLH